MRQVDEWVVPPAIPLPSIVVEDNDSVAL